VSRFDVASALCADQSSLTLDATRTPLDILHFQGMLRPPPPISFAGGEPNKPSHN
jgi:hypothetical protein